MNLSKTSPSYRILEKESTLEKTISFDYKKAMEEKPEGSDLPKILGSKRKQKKYYENPEPNWGPKPRATGN